MPAVANMNASVDFGIRGGSINLLFAARFGAVFENVYRLGQSGRILQFVK